MSERQPSHLDDSSLMWGAIFGFVIGAIVWLFHVPQRGEATRKEIVNNAKSLLGQSSEEDHREEHNQSENRPKYEYFH